MEQTLITYCIGFIIGYLVKKTNYNVIINLKQNDTETESE